MCRKKKFVQIYTTYRSVQYVFEQKRYIEVQMYEKRWKSWTCFCTQIMTKCTDQKWIPALVKGHQKWFRPHHGRSSMRVAKSPRTTYIKTQALPSLAKWSFVWNPADFTELIGHSPPYSVKVKYFSCVIWFKGFQAWNLLDFIFLQSADFRVISTGFHTEICTLQENEVWGYRQV